MWAEVLCDSLLSIRPWVILTGLLGCEPTGRSYILRKEFWLLSGSMMMCEETALTPSLFQGKWPLVFVFLIIKMETYKELFILRSISIWGWCSHGVLASTPSLSSLLSQQSSSRFLLRSLTKSILHKIMATRYMQSMSRLKYQKK